MERGGEWSAGLLDGRRLAKAYREACRVWLERTCLRVGRPPPRLDLVYWGSDEASARYVAGKQWACRQAGVVSQCHRFPAEAPAEQIATQLQQLSFDPGVHGVLLQLPLPVGSEALREALLASISPHKDVDGLSPGQRALFGQRDPARLVPCTAKGILQLLEAHRFEFRGKLAVVMGRSNLVGKPTANLLLERDCSVLCLHRQSREVSKWVAQAELLVVAIGSPQAVPLQWVQPGAVVVDVGIHKRLGALVGDTDPGGGGAQHCWVTPVPGGVGPMTVACLLQNVCEAYADQQGGPRPNWRALLCEPLNRSQAS